LAEKSGRRPYREGKITRKQFKELGVYQKRKKNKKTKKKPQEKNKKRERAVQENLRGERIPLISYRNAGKGIFGFDEDDDYQ